MLSKLSPRSILMVLASAVFGRMSTALSQIIAAIYLTPADFGAYAAAMAIATVTTALRGGGTGNYVSTMKPEEFERDGGRLFRYALLFTTIGVVLTCVAAPLAWMWHQGSNEYPARQVATVLLALALNFLAFNLAVFPRSLMIANLRLGEISVMDSFVGFVKLSATWLFAMMGAGPITLAGALLSGALVELIWVWSRSGFGTPHLRSDGPWLHRTFREMRLPLTLALMISLASQTDTATGSLFVPATVLGFYFFASQLATQPAMLAGTTLRAIFTATTAHVRGDRERENASIQTVFSGAMVFMPLVSMLIPAIFESFERAAWQGKWADSRIPVLILSATLVYPTALGLVAAPIAGLRDWKLAIRLDALRAATKIVPAAIAGGLILSLGLQASASAMLLAAAVGGAGAIVSGIELIRIVARAGMPQHAIIYELYSTPIAALLSALASAGLAHSAIEPLKPFLGDRSAAAIECALAGTTYIALALVLLRFGYTSTLERLITALPAFMQPPATRLFRL
jgi:O-antigen/teichoic acid export membrane protein